MKTIVIIISLCFLSNISFGQAAKNLFYASVEDYKNGKPLPNYEIEDNSYYSGTFGTGLKVKNGSESTKTSLSKLPSEFFTYNYDCYWLSFHERFMRIYKGDAYVVLVNGPICYYYIFPYPHIQYFSETISGNLKKFDRNVVEKYCKKYNLYDNYKNEHPKLKASTTPQERINNNMQHDIKYLNLVNDKMKP